MITGLSDKQIVSLLESHSLWSKRACREILFRKDAFVPLLLDVLDKAIGEPDPYEWTLTDFIPPVSLLLAEMRVTDAYPRLISLVSYNEDAIGLIWGDMLFDFMVPMLRDTYNGNPAFLPALIENRSVSPWVRMMAVTAYGTHYQDGHISREEITTFFRRLAYDVYSGKTIFDDKLILTEVSSCVREQRLEEMIDDVKALYARNDIEEDVYGDLKYYLEHFNDETERKDLHTDTIRELERWSWYKETSDNEDNDDDLLDNDFDDDDVIGRNDLCPCGSGKKYKYCHGK